VYLLYGPGTGGDLATAADAIYTGDSARDYAGRMVRAVGDVDGDGSPDAMVNAFREDRVSGGTTLYNVGANYLLTSFSTGSLDLATSAAAVVYGEGERDQVGMFIAEAGDVNGDGYDDVLLGSHYVDVGGNADAGELYLMAGPLSGTLDVGSAHARFPGAQAGDAAGRSGDNLGDIDGDGHDDLIIGAKSADIGGVDDGAAYVVLGPVSGTIGLGSADTVLSGEAAGDRAGLQAVSVGDLDGGGQADFVIGATKNSTEAAESGAAYIIFSERW